VLNIFSRSLKKTCHQERKLRQTKCLLFNFWMIKLNKTPILHNGFFVYYGRFDFLISTWSWSPWSSWFSIVNPDLQIKKTWSSDLDFLIFTLFFKSRKPDLQENLIFKYRFPDFTLN
jgi:hypothetical protein